MRTINFYIVILFILSACTTMEEAGKVLKNEKISTTDEFLVKKRQPLILPPDYDKIPEPNTMNKKQEKESDKIKKILKAQNPDVSAGKISGTEETILNEIRK